MMNDQDTASLSIIKRAARRRQQREGAWDAAERDDTRWPNRLKRALYSCLIAGLFAPLLLLAYLAPRMYPTDLDGLAILFGASMVLVAFFFASYYVQEWVEAREERYWFWRTSSVLLFLAIAGSMLYAMFVTADYWRPHFS